MGGTEFQYPDLSWKEPTGIMANLVANSGDNKGQLTTFIKSCGKRVHTLHSYILKIAF